MPAVANPRIQATVNPIVIQRLDEFLAANPGVSRSQAIEFLLRHALSQRPNPQTIRFPHGF
jgi:metal-responsive CopG/Arc/MetJ family transcriptional regulator